jgi:hypothetical protein
VFLLWIVKEGIVVAKPRFPHIRRVTRKKYARAQVSARFAVFERIVVGIDRYLEILKKCQSNSRIHEYRVMVTFTFTCSAHSLVVGFLSTSKSNCNVSINRSV